MGSKTRSGNNMLSTLSLILTGRKAQRSLDSLEKEITGYSQRLDRLLEREGAEKEGEETPLDEARKVKQMLAESLNERGLINYKRVEFGDAIEDFTKSISYDNQLAAAYYNRATVFYRMSDFKEALKDLERAVSLEPHNKEFNLGLSETRDRLT